MNRRRRILVIADDFTGAAEIAGIGSRYGMTAEIIREASKDSTADLLVIDTDSRSLEPAQAAKQVRGILESVAIADFDLVFKKIDSLLRGPVLAELEAAMQALSKTAAIVAPANPSRGRTITGGEYHVDGVPLHLTALANDPEYPRKSSRVLDLLGTIPPPVKVADVTSASDVHRWARSVDDRTLPAGAADFFTAILSNLNFSARTISAVPGNGRILMVCGSASESNNDAIQMAMQRGIQVVPLLATAEENGQAIRQALSKRSFVIITTGARSQARPGAVARRIAKIVQSVLLAVTIDELLIEGGSTSAAILAQMSWNRFKDCTELAPGIVRMAVVGEGIHLTAKPGSYPWPENIWNHLLAGVSAYRR